jgi:hypothetical protein
MLLLVAATAVGCASGAGHTSVARGMSAGVHARRGAAPVASMARAAPASSGMGRSVDTASVASARLTPEERRARIVTTFNQLNSVSGCWNAALRRNPAHPLETIRVRLDVAPDGRAAVTVDGAINPDLATCIRRRTVAHRFDPGEPVSTEASYSLTPGS